MQETPCDSIELPNEEGHFSPLETTMAVTRVRFPSPAPFIINDLRSSASKVQVIEAAFPSSVFFGFPSNLTMRIMARHVGAGFSTRDRATAGDGAATRPSETTGQMFRRDFILRLELVVQRHNCGHTVPAPLSYNGFSRGGSAAPAALMCIRPGRAARCRHRAATGKPILQKRFDGI